MPAGIACGLRASVCYAQAERGVRSMQSGTTDTALLSTLLRAVALGVLAVGAAGCSHLHWPWHKQPPPAPRPPSDGWPVRLAVRVMPGSLGELDVRGAQRVVLPIVPAGGKPVDLELPPVSIHRRPWRSPWP